MVSSASAWPMCELDYWKWIVAFLLSGSLLQLGFDGSICLINSLLELSSNGLGMYGIGRPERRC